MKNFYFLLIALFLSAALQGQWMLHYDFTNSLSEVNGNGPELTVLGDFGFYEEDVLSEVGSAKKWVYRFEANSGFQFDNIVTAYSLGEAYTIELYFVFDNLSSWKRVVDWKNRKSDYGAYVYNGELNFYPHAYSAEAPVVAGEYTYYVITRNAETQELLIYTDAETYITITDIPGDALIDEDNKLNFFHDDLSVPNEASSGAVAMLKIYNYTLDSTTIKNNYDDLAGNLFYIGKKNSINTIIQTFPNPVADRINVDLSNFAENETVHIKLVNTIGIVVLDTELATGNQKKIVLNTNEIESGIYILTAESESRHAIGKVLIQR